MIKKQEVGRIEFEADADILNYPRGFLATMVGEQQAKIELILKRLDRIERLLDGRKNAEGEENENQVG